MSQQSAQAFDSPRTRYLPLTLRLETLGGLATPLVLRGTPLPTERIEVFATAADNQSTVELKIFMGERPLAAKSIAVGAFQLTGIPPAPAGTAQIRVALTVAQDLSISAIATVEGTEISTTGQIAPSPKYLRQTMIEKILADADAHKEEDTAAVGQIEDINRASALLRQAEDRVKAERKKKATTLDMSAVTRAIADLGLALESGNRESIRSATFALEQSLRPPEIDVSAWLTGSPFAGMFPTSPARAAKGKAASGADAEAPKSSGAGSNRGARSGMQVSASRPHRLGRVFGGGNFTLDSSLCFVLMPFEKRLQAIYDHHVKPGVTEVGLRCQRADEVHGVNAITADIWELINRARILVADLTGRNANVFYEVGLAHALGKDVVLLTQSMDDVPFDLKGLRCLVYEYTPPGMRDFDEKFRRTIAAVVQSASGA